MEDQDAIDPGLLLDPTTGRLWVSYGTYFGTIRLIELDPTTGFRKSGNKEKDIAIDCEASDLICRNGWYYLLGTHGTCFVQCAQSGQVRSGGCFCRRYCRPEF